MKNPNNMESINFIKVENKYAIFSTIQNDVIFDIHKINVPIFCGGIVKEVNHNVYGIKKGDWIAYISKLKAEKINLAHNLTIKLKKKERDIFAILPYASYAMKLLREINPKLGQNIIILGLSFFSVLLLRILKLAGSNPLIVNLDGDLIKKELIINNTDCLINGLDLAKLKLRNVNTSTVVTCINPNKNLKEFLNELKFDKHIILKEISIYDKGLLDLNYLKGINYPYSYVRWDFKRNLNYIINILEKGKLLLDFIDYTLIKINSIDEMTKIIHQFPHESIILFSIK